MAKKSKSTVAKPKRKTTTKKDLFQKLCWTLTKTLAVRRFFVNLALIACLLGLIRYKDNFLSLLDKLWTQLPVWTNLLPQPKLTILVPILVLLVVIIATRRISLWSEFVQEWNLARGSASVTGFKIMVLILGLLAFLPFFLSLIYFGIMIYDHTTSPLVAISFMVVLTFILA